MTMTQALAFAESFEQGRGFAFLPWVATEDGRTTAAAVRARVLLLLGRVEVLCSARSEDEFDAIFDALATPKFFLELVRLVADEDVSATLRTAQAAALSSRSTARDPRAMRFLDDLEEQLGILGSTAQRLRGGTVRLEDVARAAPRAGREALESISRASSAMLALAAAAHGQKSWPEWMTGMLWNLGKRALLELAVKAGMTWEDSVDLLTSTRDRALLVKPFDRDASDRSLRLLGLA